MEISITDIAHLFISAGIFIGLWKIVGENFIQNFLKMHAERLDRTEGDEKKAKELDLLSLELERSIDDELLETRVKGVKHKEEQLQVARDEASKITDAARNESERKLEVGRDEISKLASKARGELDSQVDELAELLVKRVSNA